MMRSYEDFLSSKNLRRYLSQIYKFPILSNEEEKRLGKLIQEGDKDAQKKLIEANLRFVVSYAKKYNGMGLSLLDLINEGNIGLIEAAKRFDPDRNVRFISYAVWWVRQAIIHALTTYSRIYNIPQKLSDQISQMKKKSAQLKIELGREPSREEIAKLMGISEEDIEGLFLIEKENISLNERIYDEEIEVGDTIQETLTPSVEYGIIKTSIQEQIRKILTELDKKEVLVLKLRFGLEDNKTHTLQEIGDKLNLTRERIRQIEQKSMRKLARSHKLQQLKGYLN